MKLSPRKNVMKCLRACRRKELMFPWIQSKGKLDFKVARNSFQHLYFDGSLQPLFIT